MLPSADWSRYLRLADEDIDRLLDEDSRLGDVTTRGLGIAGMTGRMTCHARQDLVLCGVDEAVRILMKLGLTPGFAARTGQFMAAGTLILEVEGPADALHAGWKICQTVMEWASGIATMTSDILAAARTYAPRIVVLCTRKSVPFTRPLSLKAVMAGGGEVHRLGLSDTIIIFPEHRAFLDHGDDLKAAVLALRRHAPERAVMIEVATLEDAIAAAEAMADVIQLEKFTPEAAGHVVRMVAKRADGRPLIAAAGGINPQNATRYARAGVDALVTSAPFYAKPLDIQVRMERTIFS